MLDKKITTLDKLMLLLGRIKHWESKNKSSLDSRGAYKIVNNILNEYRYEKYELSKGDFEICNQLWKNFNEKIN